MSTPLPMAYVPIAQYVYTYWGSYRVAQKVSSGACVDTSVDMYDLGTSIDFTSKKTHTYSALLPVEETEIFGEGVKWDGGKPNLETHGSCF